MDREEIEAEQNLASLSQVTNYICQWRGRRPKNPQLAEKQKDNRVDDPSSQQTLVKQDRRNSIKREVSEKYDLKKWEKRVEAINKIQFPIIGDNLFVYQEQYLLQKCKINLTPCLDESTNVVQRKEGINKKIIQALEEEYIRKRLDKFRQRIDQSRKKVMKQESSAKMRYIPKIFASKKSTNYGKSIIQQEQKNQCLSSKSELQSLKKQLDKNKRKFSLPNLYKL